MSIQELINDSLLKDEQSKVGRIRSGKWSPSSFGQCLRKQYLNRQDVPKSNPPDVRTLRVFKVGNLFENFAVELLKKTDTDLQYQVKIETDDVFGFADIVNGNCVYDIKSQHSGAFTYMKPESIKEEKFCNWLQVGWYALTLNKPNCALVFISKDDLRIAEFVQPVEGYWRNMIENELTLLNHFWARKELPPAVPKAFGSEKLGDKECDKYCSWRDHCYLLEKREIK